MTKDAGRGEGDALADVLDWWNDGAGKEPPYRSTGKVLKEHQRLRKLEGATKERTYRAMTEIIHEDEASAYHELYGLAVVLLEAEDEWPGNAYERLQNRLGYGDSDD